MGWLRSYSTRLKSWSGCPLFYKAATRYKRHDSIHETAAENYYHPFEKIQKMANKERRKSRSRRNTLTRPSDILGHNDTLHSLQCSSRPFLHLPIHAPTNASRRGACTTS